MNKFIEAVGFKPTTLTENGAVTLVTTGSEIVDQFGKAGNYRGRDLKEVFADQSKIWFENPVAALRFPFYLRMVTRKVKVNSHNETSKVQTGQGARDESFKRLLWIAKNHPEEFKANIWALPIVGSWKDVWTLMFYDIQENTNAIDHELMFDLISEGLMSKTHVDLIKKFMPRIKSSSKCTTPWTKITNKLAKEFAKYQNISYQEYNKLKSTGTAHTFQKLICSRQYDKLNWNLIPGRALNLLVTGKFLSNHNLTEEYTNWIVGKPVAKFTGYVFELAKKAKKYGISAYSHGRGLNKIPFEVKHTIDAQFKGLVEKARQDGKITDNVLVALDTSGSMQREVSGLKGTTCEDIASSLAVFFAELNTGAFHNKIMMFDYTSYPYDMTGDSFCERIGNLPSVPCGGTNFQSVVEELVKIRVEHPEIPLEEYPKTILVVSDMNFDSVNYNIFGVERSEPTNYEYSVKTLKKAFPEEFVDSMKFIWWDCASRYGNTQYETTAQTEGSYFFSGFDGSVINMLLGQDMVEDENTGETRRPTAEEIVSKALSQEILSYVNLT